MTTEKPKLTRKEYEEELRKLQIELCRLQGWVKHKGLRVIVVFEGRDAAAGSQHPRPERRTSSGLKCDCPRSS